MLSSVLQTVYNYKKSIIRENSSPLYSMSLYYDQSFITCHAKVTSVKFAYLFLLSFKSRLSLIFRVNVVLNRTVVVVVSTTCVVVISRVKVSYVSVS